MRKTLSFIAALIIAFSFTFPVKAEEKLDFVEAKSAVLICINNGEVLYKMNEYEHLSPASVTKIMTILLVLEALENKSVKLSDKVTASAEAVSMGGSQIWLEVGETMTLEELFKAVVVASANDACTALAEYVGGSVTAFVDMMNKRAEELGCRNTHFENCNGLDDTAVNHYSCAYDLALITCEVMKHELIKKYTGIWLDSLRDGKTELNNTNKLVNTYNGITGLKTGTTSNAGFCISATAERDNMQLAAIVLGSETSEKRFDTAAALLDWGFSSFDLIEPEIDMNKLKRIEVKGGEYNSVKPVVNFNKKLAVKKGKGEIEYTYNIKKKISAPLKKGDSLGEIIIKADNKEIGKINVVSPVNINAISVKSFFQLILNNI